MGKTGTVVAIAALATAAVAAYWLLGRVPEPGGGVALGQSVSMAGELPVATFQTLSCGRDWPEDVALEPIITKTVDGHGSHFLVLDPITCGMAVKDPGYEVSGNAVVLSYAVFAPAEVASCYCEHKSRFSFQGLPVSVGSARIEHN